jgi:hypothetical protein
MSGLSEEYLTNDGGPTDLDSCHGSVGTFTGKLRITKDGCGDKIPGVTEYAEISIGDPDTEWLLECNEHVLNSESWSRYVDNVLCRVIYRRMLETFENYYIGRVIYFLDCPYSSCSMEAEVLFEKKEEKDD